MNFLLGVYLSSINASLIMNMYYTVKSHKKAKEESERKLLYKKGLNYRTKSILLQRNFSCLDDLRDNFVKSFIPIYNFIFTVQNIDFEEDFDKIVLECYEQCTEMANEEEINARRMNIKLLRKLREKIVDVPNDVEFEKLGEEYLIGDKDTKKILKYNNMNYDIEMNKLENELEKSIS